MRDLNQFSSKKIQLRMVYPEQSTAAVDNDFWDFVDANWGLEPDLVAVPVIEANNNYGEAYNLLELHSQNDRPKRNRKKKLDGITYAVLEPHFNQPLGDVAKRFRVSENTLRSHCRKLGIRIWPYEKTPPPPGPMEESNHNVPSSWFEPETPFVNPILYDFERHDWVGQHR